MTLGGQTTPKYNIDAHDSGTGSPKLKSAAGWFLLEEETLGKTCLCPSPGLLASGDCK
jgi:hypothetical protein